MKKKVSNLSELHFSEVTFYKIHTLVAEIQPGHFTSKARNFYSYLFESDKIVFDVNFNNWYVIKLGQEKKYLGHFGLCERI